MMVMALFITRTQKNVKQETDYLVILQVAYHTKD